MVLRALFVIAWLASLFAACTRVEVVGTPNNAPIGEGGVAGQGRAGAGSVAGEQVGGAGATSVAQGGAPGSLELALWPTYAATPAREDAAAVLAAVATLSVGSLTLPIHERWDELSGATGSPRAVTWQRLDAMIQPYRERQGSVALCIDVVDRTQRAWPFSGELDAAAALPAMKRTIDEALGRYAGQLSLLCFGYQVDLYLARAPATAREALLAFLGQAVSYAERHPQRVKTRTALGIAVSLQALSSSGAADVDELRLGDSVVAVYDAFDEGDGLKPPGAIAEELPAALSGIVEREDRPRPLLLFEAGYPSSVEVGSSELAQHDFVASLLLALEENSAGISGAFVYGSDDRSAAQCEAEAASFYPPAEGAGGAAGGGQDEPTEEASAAALAARASARCSMGLRAENARPKQAWPSVLSALSRE